ncbi:MAG TPA: PilZ domain-containing protein [Sphingomonadaceae bacterium]|nr:PilZ domain-containing protein [Sphingomonadaceae bacterium]
MSNLAYALDHEFESRKSGFDRRCHRRRDVDLNSLAYRRPSYHASVRLVDLSTSGCRLLDHKREFVAGDYLTFSLDGIVVVEGVVRWTQDARCGVEFLSPIPHLLVESLG